MKSHLNEPWEFPEYQWRAVDEDGELVYHGSSPELLDRRWFSQTHKHKFTENYTYDTDNWQNSLQSKEDYERRPKMEEVSVVLGESRGPELVWTHLVFEGGKLYVDGKQRVDRIEWWVKAPKPVDIEDLKKKARLV